MKASSEIIETVKTPVGDKSLDNTGAVIGAARLNPAGAYCNIPALLKEYINNGTEGSWQDICSGIDKVYEAVSVALEVLDREEAFSSEVKADLKAGKKLLLKPNHVMLPEIDPVTHGPGFIGACTPWAFFAAVMRWFHDELDISYHQMAVGEAGATTPQLAATISKTLGKTINTLAVMEGKYGKNYGGWGFYFVRRYLFERHPAGHKDDPMQGYKESLAGTNQPPGKQYDVLPVYDLNIIDSDLSNGREVSVPDGINFKKIIMHKAVVGGNPADKDDRSAWPGCYLVNVAKLKIHLSELFTGAVKNIGIGLYPMQLNMSREPGRYDWKYAIPNLAVPLVKMKVPHKRWLIKIDHNSGMPVRDDNGNCIFTETGGLEASIADSFMAVMSQGVHMLHILDSIDAVNIAHIGPRCTCVSEGLVFAATDALALDACGGRYLFTTLPMAQVASVEKQYKIDTDVIQRVPFPALQGRNIISSEGYDSSLSRYGALQYWENRGLGQIRFKVTGHDLWQGGRLASVQQRLGRVDKGSFSEILTPTMYHTPNKVLWDLQRSSLRYLELNDKITGSDYKQRILNAYDENGDGVIDYMETGRSETPYLMALGGNLSTQDVTPGDALKLRFLIQALQLKSLKKEWNINGYEPQGQPLIVQGLSRAFAMSNSPVEAADPFYDGMTWGGGKWPSLQYAMHQQVMALIYGLTFPARFDLLMSPFGHAFTYADMQWNGGAYNKAKGRDASEDIIRKYFETAASGGPKLPFTMYVPRGFGSNNGTTILNVVETDRPDLVFTVDFDGRETWKELHLTDFNLK